MKTSMIYRTSAELPRSLRGYALWLLLAVPGQDWVVVCCLRPQDARAALRWDGQQRVRRLAILGFPNC